MWTLNSGCPWPMFEAHIVLQKIAAQHSFESLLAENNNTNALHHRYTQSLIPRQGRLQPVGLIYFIFFKLLSSAGASSDKSFFSQLPWKSLRWKGEEKNPKINALYLGRLVMLIIPSVSWFAQCQNMGSVSEFIQNLAPRRRQEVSDWKVCDDGFCSPWLSW